MSFLLELEEDRLGEQLMKHFARFEKEIQLAEPLFSLDGRRLEHVARDLPYHQVNYARLAQEAKSISKWLENHKAKLESIHHKNYSRGQRALSATDQRLLIGGEKDIIETNQLIIEATLLQHKLDEITESFRQMGWMVGHITKLRVAELGDIVL